MLRRLVVFVRLGLISAAVALRNAWWRAGWVARGVNVARGVVIRQHAPDAIDIAPGAAIGHGTLLLSTTEMAGPNAPPSRLVVGAGTAINEYCNLRASGGEIRIGAKCLIAQMVTMVASNHAMEAGLAMLDQPWSAEPHSVLLGDDVWVGAGVVLLPGARIGTGAVIAAGAVVRGSVPAYEIWGGVPAHRLGRRPGPVAVETTIAGAR